MPKKLTQEANDSLSERIKKIIIANYRLEKRGTFAEELAKEIGVTRAFIDYYLARNMLAGIVMSMKVNPDTATKRQRRSRLYTPTVAAVRQDTEAKDKTDEEVFLAWCKKNKVRPVLMPRSKVIYTLPQKTIKIEFFGLKIKPPEITVYFDEEGNWIGGTNWLWDARLPWIKNSHKRTQRDYKKRGIVCKH